MSAKPSPAKPAEAPIEPVPGLVYHIARDLGRLFATGLLRLRVRGGEHVPESGPAVLLSNHESYFDPHMVTFLTPRPVAFVAKDELFRGPLVGRHFNQVNAFPLRRSGVDRQMFRTAAKLLADGRLLCLFPEGTRSPDGQLQPGQPGAVSVALKARVPIVPVAISGTFQFLPRSGGIRLAPVAVAAGPPLFWPRLDAKAASDKQLLTELTHRVMAEIRCLREGLERDFGTGAARAGE